jgi:hypothetical protein
MGATSKWHFFLRLPSGTFVVSKLWTFISSSNQTYLEYAREIFYSPQKDLSNDVLHASIKDHLTPILRGFIIGSQIHNLTSKLSFDHNSCISGLNEQCEGILGIYTLRNFQWYHEGPIWWLFIFSTKALNIWNFRMSATPKVEMHLGVIGLNFLHSLLRG